MTWATRRSATDQLGKIHINQKRMKGPAFCGRRMFYVKLLDFWMFHISVWSSKTLFPKVHSPKIKATKNFKDLLTMLKSEKSDLFLPFFIVHLHKKWKIVKQTMIFLYIKTIKILQIKFMCGVRNLEKTIRFSLKSWPFERFHRLEMS